MSDSANIDLRKQIEKAGINFFIINRDFRFHYANNSFMQLLGISSIDEIKNTPITQWVRNEDSESLEYFLHTCLTVGGIKNFEFQFLSAQKKLIYCLINATTETTNSGLLINGFCFDISGIKHNEENLKKAKEKAEQSDNLKTAFLTNLSHEIRTPMNAIIGFSELLMGNELPQEQKEKYINYINSSGSVLLKLIDDIIDIAKIQSKQLVVKKNRTDVNSLLYEVYSSYTKLVRSKKGDDVEIIWNKRDKSDRVKIYTDPLRFRQIFTNLLSNALKFTDKGNIEFGYDLINENESQTIRFFVKDTGVGLSSQNKEIVFNRFYRIEEDSMRLYRGAGLGLTITKSLIDLLGGKIWVESELGKGSTFFFSFPMEDVEFITPTQITDKKEVDFSKWEGKTVLVAEDEDINFIYIEELLKKYHLNILHAKNGLEAVQMFKEHQNEIEIILMDIKMPIMDGYEATHQIKSINADKPIIAQTAYALAGEREKIIDAGCDDYISKPLKPKSLIKVISNYLN